MHTKDTFKKKNRRVTAAKYYEDDISLTGRKGGKVLKERQQTHEIDLELRNFSYR